MPDTMSHAYKAQSARDAQERNYGTVRYWDYLERAAEESHAHWTRRGDLERANHMMTRSLADALRGNDGE